MHAVRGSDSFSEACARPNATIGFTVISPVTPLCTRRQYEYVIVTPIEMALDKAAYVSQRAVDQVPKLSSNSHATQRHATPRHITRVMRSSVPLIPSAICVNSLCDRLYCVSNRTARTVSPMGDRFLTSLISEAPTRLGKNGVGEVMSSTWLAGFPWERIRELRAPYVTEGAARVKVRRVKKKYYSFINICPAL